MAVTIATGSYPNGLGFNPRSPAVASGTGTNALPYGGTTPVALNIPGSNRADGIEFAVRLAGYVFPNTASNVTLTVSANYGNFANGASQYPTASITSASMTNNVALYNGTNNFLIGQYVNLGNIANANLNGIVGPLQTANATAFTSNNINGAALAIANIANAAQTATAAISSTPIYTGAASPTLKVNTNAPWYAVLDAYGDSKSGIFTMKGTDQTVNTTATGYSQNVSTGTIQPVPGVNFQVEPPIYLTVATTFGTSDANNAAYLQQMSLEGS
jgi:hypothetical protein